MLNKKNPTTMKLPIFCLFAINFLTAFAPAVVSDHQTKDLQNQTNNENSEFPAGYTPGMFDFERGIGIDEGTRLRMLDELEIITKIKNPELADKERHKYTMGLIREIYADPKLCAVVAEFIGGRKHPDEENLSAAITVFKSTWFEDMGYYYDQDGKLKHGFVEFVRNNAQMVNTIGWLAEMCDEDIPSYILGHFPELSTEVQKILDDAQYEGYYHIPRPYFKVANVPQIVIHAHLVPKACHRNAVPYPTSKISAIQKKLLVSHLESGSLEGVSRIFQNGNTSPPFLMVDYNAAILVQGQDMFVWLASQKTAQHTKILDFILSFTDPYNLPFGRMCNAAGDHSTLKALHKYTDEC